MKFINEVINAVLSGKNSARAGSRMLEQEVGTTDREKDPLTNNLTFQPFLQKRL